MLAVDNSLRHTRSRHRKKRVLIVDDEVAILLGFKKIIESHEVEADTAENVEEAIALLQEKKYDFVITDLKMGSSSGEDGFKVLAFAKEKAPRTEVILITGYGTPEIMEKTFALGAAYYYEKPVSATTLRDALKRLGM